MATQTSGIATSMREFDERQTALCNLLSRQTSTSSSQNSAVDYSQFLSVDSLLDSIFAIYDDCKVINATSRPQMVQDFLKRYEPIMERLQSLRLNKNDFEQTKLLGKGAFGEVRLVKCKIDGKTYAMKVLKKSEMLRQQETSFFMEERLVLTMAKPTNWLTQIYCSFQDDTNLYLVMEFLPGGDLMTLLCRNEEGVFDEDTCRFYIAETILAVHDLHQMNFVHRDIKPDNLLIDSQGHIKLADFGSCIRVNNDGHVTSNVAVGTPDYISPEVLRAQEGKAKYGKECDWWSIGIILFEMLTGDPPFYGDSLVETYGKIMDFKKHLKIPQNAELSPECIDLINKLICDREVRLGRNGIDEIKKHPFFKSLNWDTLRQKKAPFVPELKGANDTTYFDEVDQEEEEEEPSTASKKGASYSSSRAGALSGNSLPFVGYSYNNTPFTLSTAPLLHEAAQGHRARSRTVSRAAQQDMDSKKQSEIDMDVNLMKVKLKQESQRIIALDASVKNFELELAQAKKQIATKAAQVDASEQAKATLTKDKNVVEAEMKELRRRLDQEISSKIDLESRLASLKKSYDALIETHASSSNDESRQELEKELKEAKSSLEEQQSKVETLELSLKEAEQRVFSATEDINSLQEQLIAAKGTLESKERQILEQIALTDHLNQELEKLIAHLNSKQHDVNNLQQELEKLKSARVEDQQKLENLKRSLNETEKIIHLKDIDMKQLQAKYDEVVKDVNIFKEQLKNAELTVASLESSVAEKSEEDKQMHRQNSDIINDMRAKFEAAQEERKRVQELLDVSCRGKLELEMALNDSRQRVALLDSERITLSKQVNDLEIRLDVEVSAKSKALQQSETIERELLATRSEVAKLKSSLSAANNSIQERSQQLDSVSKASSVEKASLKKKMEEHESALHSLQSKFNKTQQDLSKELKLRGSLEKQNKSMAEQQSHLQQELSSIKTRLEKNSADRELVETELASLQKNQALRDYEISQLRFQLETVSKAKDDFELELFDLRSKYEGISNEKTAVLAENEILETQMDEIKAKLDEVMASLDLETVKQSEYETQIARLTKKAELDQLKMSELVKKMEGTLLSQQQQTKMGLFASTSSNSSDKKLLKQRTREMRTLEQRLAQEVTARKSLESELNEAKNLKSILEKELSDLRANINVSQSRRASNMTNNMGTILRRVSVTMTKRPKSNGVVDVDDLLHDMDPSKYIVEGPLRIPKPKGVRDGWIKYHAVLNDYVLTLYDTDPLVPPKIILNLQQDTFIVRPLQPKELLHVSSKEASCIFVIFKSAAHDSNGTTAIITGASGSIQSLEALSFDVNVAEITAKIKQLEKDLEVEDKIKKGLDSMIRVVPASQRSSVETQLEGSSRKIAYLKAELEKLHAIDLSLSSTSEAATTDLENSTMNNSVAGSNMSLFQDAEKTARLQQLDKDLAKEEATRDALQRLIANTDPKKSLQAQKELQSCLKQINSLKIEIDAVKNMSPTSSGTSKSKSSTDKQVLLFNGHEFRPRTFNISTNCQHCHEMLWGLTSQGVECITCKFVCHKTCHSLITTSCNEVTQLRGTKPLYLMAHDEADRVRWINSLEALHKVAQIESGKRKSTLSG